MKHTKQMYLVLLLFSMSTLLSAASVVVNLDTYYSIFYEHVGRQWNYVPAGRIGLQFSGAKEGNIRGETSITFDTTKALTSIDQYIEQAYLKARFPNVRLTIGKTRQSWGDGILFNAGDIMFTATDVSVNLGAETLRTQTEWMAGLQFPLTDFSFIEAVTMPKVPYALADMAYGARYYNSDYPIKFEFGFGSYRKNSDRLHIPYISLQGNIGIDWYMGISTECSQTAFGDHVKESSVISGGLFWMQSVGYRGTLSARFEAIFWPFRDWSSTTMPVMFAYPEVSYAVNESLTITFRSIISVQDASASTVLHIAWKPLQDMTLSLVALMNIGESTDIFSHEKVPLACTIGSSWLF